MKGAIKPVRDARVPMKYFGTTTRIRDKKFS